jgi:hypothetical protein
MFTKKEFSDIRNKINKAIEPIAAEYGLEMSAGSISYSNSSFRLSIQAKKKQVNGINFEQAEFLKLCHLYGLKPEDYNEKIIINGEVFRLVGFNINAPKNPLKVIREKDGKEYRTAISSYKIHQLLNK